MSQEAGQLSKEILEEALRGALKSVLGGTGPDVNPRAGFYSKFQREMEEHDRDFERKYDEDLNTTLIFSGLFSAVTSAFIIDVQSDLGPDYEEMNNTLLEMLLNATTGNLPADSAVHVPRWPGPDPVIVQAQCILYTTLCTTLLASFLAMLGKQWLNRYRQNEGRGSTADRSRMRERKLSGIETWKFHVVMESLPLILQCALVLLGFALSRYLWQVNRSVSSVVIGFTSFGFLFYLLIMTASTFSFDCPFQTPFSPLIRFVIGLVVPYWQNFRRAFGPKRKLSQPGTLRARHDLPLSMNTVGRGHGLEANIIALTCMAPAAIQFPWSVTPLFAYCTEGEGDRLDARCISRMFMMSTDVDVVTSIMDFIPEIIWHGGIKNVPLKRIYDILMGCFDLSGPSPVIIPRLRDVAYLSARAFAHIGLQRRCITQYEEHKQDSWKALCADHPLLSPVGHSTDPDLRAVLFMVDMTLGYDNKFPWKQARIAPPLRAWMSHVFLYHAWHEGRLSEVVMDFVEDSLSLEPPSDIVITDCLFTIGLMIGVPFHVNDITMRDKSREKDPILRKVFGALSGIFSSRSIRTPLALRALQLVTRLTVMDVYVASYELFTTVMASNDLTDLHWEAARLALCGALREFYLAEVTEVTRSTQGGLDGILRFLDYHLRLQEAGQDHRSAIRSAMDAVFVKSDKFQADPLTVGYIKDLIRDSPSFAKGVRSMVHPDNDLRLRQSTIGLIAIASDQWFSSSLPAEEMSKFCEHLAVFVVDNICPGAYARECSVIILFEMLRSPEWREHIVPRLWSVLAYCAPFPGERESFWWCLKNAIYLLEFTRGLADGGELKWWYGALWFHYDKLDAKVRDEVERIAKDMSAGDGLSDLNLCLDHIARAVARKRHEADLLLNIGRRAIFGMDIARLSVLEGNSAKLAQITGGRR